MDEKLKSTSTRRLLVRTRKSEVRRKQRRVESRVSIMLCMLLVVD